MSDKPENPPAVECAERIIEAAEGCMLVGPADKQIAFQKAVRDFRVAQGVRKAEQP